MKHVKTIHVVEPLLGKDGRYRYIYKITNNISGRVYIGKHKVRSWLTPYTDHYNGSGVAINEAYKRYGRENFTKEIIEYCETDEQLNQREIEYIAQLNRTNTLTYNVSSGGEGADEIAVAHSIAKTSRKPIVLFEFTSKFNNKHFERGYIFASASEAGREIGFGNPNTFSTNIMYNPSHPGIWVDVYNNLDWYTAFVYQDELESLGGLDKACELYKQRYQQWRESYDKERARVLEKSHNAAKTANKKRIKCLNAFTSHINGRYFEAGHIFESVDDANNAVGYTRRSMFSNIVICHPTHPMQMYRKYGRSSLFVAAFEFVDDEE